MVYDCVIIGGGPAGLTASIYARRAGLGVLVLEKLYEGGQLANIHAIDNYPGMYGIDGNELTEKLVAHARVYGYDQADEEVMEIRRGPDDVNVFTVVADQNLYEARTVIIASGAKPKKLGAAGEEIYTGRGVSYCATCDGTFFRGKDVAVIGGGNTAVQDAIYLARLCRNIYLVHRRDKLRAEKHLADAAMKLPEIEFIYDSVLEEISGNGTVEELRLKNIKTGEERNIGVAGVFIAAGITPDSDFVRGFLELDGGGFIITDERMRTSVPGVFAAGDVRTTPLRQIITAAADGAVAADSAGAYLDM